MQEPGPSNSGNLTKRPTKKVINYFFAKNVTLHETENAWVPNCKRAKEHQSSDDVNAQIEKTKKSVRSLLNKITQDNMDTITEKIMSLPINTCACLTSIIELVFEKAIAEPGFTPQYAGLCHAMRNVKVLSNDGNMKESFKSLLLSTCQKTFDNMNIQERKEEKMLLEIESCQDMETKKLLRMEYEETERQNRRRSIGNSRFMCELFNVKLLKRRMLKQCIENLSNSRKEEKLECLCNILKNVGRNLDLTTTFQKLEELLLVKNRNIIPTRIRFMIMDTIDLKNNGWVSRNADKMLSSPQSKIKENSNMQPEISETAEKQKRNAFSWDQTNRNNESKIIKKYNALQKEGHYIDKKDKSPTVDHFYQPTKNNAFSWDQTNQKFESEIIKKYNALQKEGHYIDKKDKSPILHHVYQPTKNNKFSWDQTNQKFESEIIKKYNALQKETHYVDKKDKSPTNDHIYQPTQESGPSNNEYSTTGIRKEVTQDSLSNESMTLPKTENTLVTKCKVPKDEHRSADMNDTIPTVDHTYQPTSSMKENSNIQPEILETAEKQKRNAFSWDQTNRNNESKIIKKYNALQKEGHYIDKKDKSPTVDHFYQPTQESGPSNNEYSTTGTRKEVTQDSLSNESMTLPKKENTLVTKCKVPKDEHQSADMNDTIPTVDHTYQPTSSMKENSNIQPEILETAEKQKNNAFSWDQTITTFDSKIIIKDNALQKEGHYIDKKDKSPTVDHVYQPTQESGPSNNEYSTTGIRKEVTQDSLSNESMTLPKTENTLVTKCKVPKDEHQSADMNDTIPTVDHTYHPTSSMKENSNIQPEIADTAEKQSINTEKDLISTSEDQKFKISDYLFPLINTILQIGIFWCKY